MHKGEVFTARVVEPATNIETANGSRWVMTLRSTTTNEVVKVWDNDSPKDYSPLTQYTENQVLLVRRLAAGKNYVEIISTESPGASNGSSGELPAPRGRQHLGPVPKPVALPAVVRQRLAVVLGVYDRVLEHVGATPNAADVMRLVELVLAGADGETEQRSV